MENFVRLDGAPRIDQQFHSSGIWGKLPLFIPVIGAIFEWKKTKEIKQQMSSLPNLATRVALLQESNKIHACGAVRDLIETTGLFLLAGYGVKVPYLIDPVYSYLFGAATAVSLVIIRPIQVCYNNRVITQLRNSVLV